MRRPAGPWPKRLLAALLLAAPAAFLPGATALAAPPALDLGVTTHFGQGWPAAAWSMLGSLPVVTVRDAVGWRQIETVRGRYDFTPKTIGHLERLCAGRHRVILGLLLANPLYDGGQTVHTPAGRAALARYVKAVLDRVPGCVAGIEIGNEINIRANFAGPAALDLPRNYVAIVAAIREAVKPAHPDVRLLAGSTNAVGTGFLERLFGAGLLEVADAVVVHPYRQDPVNLDWELERLQATMAAAGRVLPIVASEFGYATPDSAVAARFLLKMAVLMAASGVAEAQWYALMDQPGFPTMGLFTREGSRKPVGDAFVAIATEFLGPSQPARLNPDEPALFHYRLAPDRQVIWGAERSFAVTGQARYRDAEGRVVAKPALLSDEPLVIEGAATVTLGPARVLADSLTDYGRPRWRYAGQRGPSPEIALGPVAWTWSSFIGSPALRPAVVNQRSLVLAGGGSNPVRLRLGWTAPRAQSIRAAACLRPTVPRGDGIQFRLLLNGRTLLDAPVVGEAATFELPVVMSHGDELVFETGPNLNAVGDVIAYRFQVLGPGAALPTC
jgi:hypothetical protein